jgi:hypothetical protein
MRALRAFAPALLLASLVWSQVARADEPAPSCGIKVILATHEGNGMDPRLVGVKHYLAKDPFTSYKSFQLLDEKKWAMRPAQAEKLKLPNGKEVALTYVDSATGPNGRRVRLRLEISDEAKKLLNTTFALDEGAYVLQAGQRHSSGLLILGVSCDKK